MPFLRATKKKRRGPGNEAGMVAGSLLPYCYLTSLFRVLVGTGQSLLSAVPSVMLRKSFIVVSVSLLELGSPYRKWRIDFRAHTKHTHTHTFTHTHTCTCTLIHIHTHTHTCAHTHTHTHTHAHAHSYTFTHTHIHVHTHTHTHTHTHAHAHSYTLTH